MRAIGLPNFPRKFSASCAFALAMMVQLTGRQVNASETKEATRVNGPAEIILAVHPVVGKPNQSRTVFVQQVVIHNRSCGPVDITLDTSLMESQNLVLISAQVREGFFCAPLMPASDLAYRFDAEIKPSKVGPLTVLWKGTRAGTFSTRFDGPQSEITIQTVADTTPSPASKYDTNGMWFDAATNGSGIALHHNRATSDVAFGTWFLYSKSGARPAWSSLQSAEWKQDGSVLEGLLYSLSGRCPLPSVVACPAIGSYRGPLSREQLEVAPLFTRITFQSSTRARADVFSLGGTVLFTSDLTKLLF